MPVVHRARLSRIQHISLYAVRYIYKYIYIYMYTYIYTYIICVYKPWVSSCLYDIGICYMSAFGFFLFFVFFVFFEVGPQNVGCVCIDLRFMFLHMRNTPALGSLRTGGGQLLVMGIGYWVTADDGESFAGCFLERLWSCRVGGVHGGALLGGVCACALACG